MPHRPLRCPLCFTDGPDRFASVGEKTYRECPTCRLVFLSPVDHLSPSEERARYERHENDPADPGYRRFLSRLTDHLVPHLTPGDSGLDYGSGPAPALARMLEERGCSVRTYDPYFVSDAGALDGRYDFITCTETAEHFGRPWVEFRRFDRLLTAGGWIGIMTRMLERLDRVEVGFEQWHYRRDATHVSFYRRATMKWVACQYGWRCWFPGDDIVLLHKPHLLER